MSVYERNTDFPKLPHGIRLILEVTENGTNEVIARGFAGGAEVLLKIKKHLKSKRRSSAASLSGTSGIF